MAFRACWRSEKLLVGIILVCFLGSCLFSVYSLSQSDHTLDQVIGPFALPKVDLKKRLALHRTAQPKVLLKHGGSLFQHNKTVKIPEKSEEKNQVFVPHVGLVADSQQQKQDENIKELNVVEDDSNSKQGFVPRVGFDSEQINDGKADIPSAFKEKDFAPPNYNLHVFYYPWYGNPEQNGKYLHWNHNLIPHWNKQEAKKWPTGRHQPPDDVGANFYPSLGAYSSSDPAVIEHHMQQMRYAGIGVFAVSWYPPEQADNEGQPSDSLIPALMDAAQKYSLKVAFHIEPYEGRTDWSLQHSVRYIVDTYGTHPAFYRHTRNGKNLPLFYVYDSYNLPAKDWRNLLSPSGSHTIRNTAYDAIFLGLLVELKHKNEILQGGFDGFYTYFATNGFTYGSSFSNWKTLKQFANQNKMMFVPSIGPGYVDTRVRPWNGRNTRKRLNGKYYNDAFQAAFDVTPEIISVTSFNEWHEGTQVEMAVPKKVGEYTYNDYTPNSPEFYLQLTRNWSEKFKNLQ
ncbi:glycoprotein endo-alpha-1,2-mannosidase-like [Branchiostoma lanceolatum]|uniref:glycoprotein endo-alpha-1,2-mannosidase-like n=1 Tax=Branchiostoma lanceolatum TaxID=7740 RepID=UPI003452968E